MALSVARAMLVVCIAIWAAIVGVIALGLAPSVELAMVLWLTGLVASFGIAISALACLVLQAVRFLRMRRERSRHA